MTYLLPMLDPDGSPLRGDIFDVKDYKAYGNGIADDTTAIAAARAAARAAGGGIVFYPPGTYISGNQNISNDANIIHMGAGSGASIIKLRNGANTDLFSAQTGSISLSAAANSGSVGTLANFGFIGLMLDGNKANQTSGTSYPLRFYGYKFLFRDLEIQNGYTGGVLCDWNGVLSGGMEARCENVRTHDNNGIGWQMGGPHDSRLDALLSYHNGSHNFHFAPNANGIQGANSHAYLPPSTSGTCNWLIEIANGCNFVNCISDGGQNIGVAILGNSVAWQGEIYTSSAGNVGVQLGQQAGQTPFPGQILQSTPGAQSGGTTTAALVGGTLLIANINGCTGGSISVQNEDNGLYLTNIFQTSGTIFPGSAFNATDTCLLNVTGQSGKSIAQIPTAQSLAAKQLAINTNPNSAIAALIGTGADGNEGVVIFANSTSQSVPLLVVQNSSFVNQFYVDKAGNVTTLGNIVGTKFAGGSAGGVNTGIEFLIGLESDTNSGLVIYAHSTSQSGSLLALQNSSFVNVFSVDLNGAMLLNGGSTMRSGSGAPSNTVGANGDYYFRTDTPGTANQRIYVKSAGSWVGIV